MTILRALLTATLLLPALAPAAPAPDFSLPSASGETVRLSDFRGRHVVLEWTNHQCPFVRKHYDAGNMQAQQAAASEQNVVWLTIISSAPGKQGHVSGAEALAIAAKAGATPDHILLDESGEVGRAYDAKTTPHMYLVGPEGELLYAGGIDSIPSADKGDIPAATQYLVQAMDQALAGEPIAVASSRPYGCTIKY